MRYLPPIIRQGPGGSPVRLILIAVLVLIALIYYSGGGGNPAGLFRAAWSLAFLLPALIISLSFHEFAHAWTASKLGDDTAARQGRLTIDPRAHLDPLGTFMLILTVILGFGIGWAKPVPINPWRLRIGPRTGMAVVAIAGPIANLLIAFVALQIVGGFGGFRNPSDLLGLLIDLARLNVVLAVFNLLPIPPLDGYRVLLGLLPSPAANSFASIEPYGPMILLMVIFIGRGLLFGIISLFEGPLLRALAAPILGVIVGG